MKKREFIKKAGAASLLAGVGVNVFSCASESVVPGLQEGDSVKIDMTDPEFSDLQNEDGWALDVDNKILLVNISGDILAFSSVCPHAGYFANWQYSEQLFVCTKHGSSFTNTGSFVSGPARKGLSELTVSVDGNIITVTA